MKVQVKAMLIDEEHFDQVRRLLRTDHIPLRFIESPTYVIWTDLSEDMTAWTLPRTVFYDKYTIVEHRESHVVAERL